MGVPTSILKFALQVNFENKRPDTLWYGAFVMLMTAWPAELNGGNYTLPKIPSPRYLDRFPLVQVARRAVPILAVRSIAETRDVGVIIPFDGERW